MFGWEFPPYSSGGLGTACHGLTKGLSNQGIEVTFVMPKAETAPEKSHVKLLVAGVDKIDSDIDSIKIKHVPSLLVAYATTQSYTQNYWQYHRSNPNNANTIYSQNLYDEVQRYAQIGADIAKKEPHDIIHCHDWMTYPAGIAAKKVSGRPFVIHVHATEFDRTGDNPNPYIYDIEKKGMQEADHIMAVSQFTKNKIVEHYGINPAKIKVVHNAVEFNENRFDKIKEKISKDDKIVLFLGRITIQKGPDWFLKAAKRVLEIRPNIKFLVAGSGDMEGYMIEEAAKLGIADKVLFTGFLKGKDVDRVYSMADLYVMPSISEPFGITPLEAMRNNTPVLISNQSGVSEVIKNALKVDFWNTEEMANKIIGILDYKEAHKTLREEGAKEVMKFDWNEPAKKCIDVYEKAIKGEA